MIRHLNVGSFMKIDNGYVGEPYISPHSNPMTGMVRYINNNFEVYDGNMNTWHKIGQAYPMISLTESAVKAIVWAIKEMEFKSALENMAEEIPAVKVAYENMKRSMDQLKTTIILSTNEHTTS